MQKDHLRIFCLTEFSQFGSRLAFKTINQLKKCSKKTRFSSREITLGQNSIFCQLWIKMLIFAPAGVCSRRIAPAGVRCILILKLLPQCAEVFPGDLKMTFFFTFSLEKFNGALKLAGLALAFVLCLTQHFYCGKMLSRLNMNIE